MYILGFNSGQNIGIVKQLKKKSCQLNPSSPDSKENPR